MIKVLISDKLHPAGVALVENADGIEVKLANKPPEDELCEMIKDVDALIVRSGTKVTQKVLAAAQKLQVVGRAGIGVDNIDVAEASRLGVMVMNAPSGNSITTAEHALSMMMAMARRIPQATMSMKAGRWEKGRFMGKELYEQTLGVVGLGNIGRLVAQRAGCLGMKVIGADPYTSQEAADKLDVELVEFDELLSRSDFITIHAPLNAETRGLFGASTFNKIKPGVFLINCARGGIIDEVALADALEKKQVGGVALDVFETEPPPADHPLLKRDDVICTPHLGASTSEAQEKVAVELVQQVVDFLQSGTIRNAINLPAVRGEVPAQVQPYLSLGEKLGSFQAMTFGGFKEVEVLYAGAAFADMPGLQLLTNAALKGLLNVALDIPVNLVNAPILAADYGIKVKESRTTASGMFSNLMTIVLKRGSETASAAGTLFQDESPRLVKLDGISLEAPMAGQLLVLRNEDRPGVIGNVGSVLGNNNINVSRLHVGLNKKTNEAIALWNIDTAVPDEVLELIEGLPHVQWVRGVTL